MTLATLAFAAEKLTNFWVNNGKTTVCLIVYMILNAIAFGITYYRYRTGDNKAVYELLGEGVTMARGAAAMLNFNCAIILFTVCRNLLTRLRSTFVHSLLPLDSNIQFHKLCAWVIALSVATHATAHYYNYETLGDVLPVSSHRLAYGTVAGATGHVITMTMVIMYTAAMEKVRKQCFELFWFSHHLFVVFFGVLLIHGTPSFLQPNQFWGWFLIPGMAYCMERLIRVVRGDFTTEVAAIIQHPSSVIELQLRKPSTSIVAGQYIFVCCPSIAPYEWHPFTLTSAPAEDIVSVHIRVVGDWTKALAARLGLAWTKGGDPIDADAGPGGYGIAFKIDGPFGTASEDVYDYEVAVLVGAGIGVTPFASILKDLWYRIMEVSQLKLRRVYFIWTARDKSAFEWFASIISALEGENLDDFLRISVYLTAKLSLEEAREIAYAGGEGTNDAITGLRSPTFFGRPNFDQIYQQVRDENYDPSRLTVCGVFLCGPAVIAKKLRFLANKYTDKQRGWAVVFHKENF